MSAEQQSDGFNLDDRDRLPWLEPAGIEEEPERVSPLKVLGLVALGLALLGVIVGGGYWLKNKGQGGGGENAKLIAAKSATYKIPANASDAKEFQGEGDQAFEASEGGEATGKIDASKVPETPRTDLKAVEKKAPETVKAPVAKPTVKAAVKNVPADTKKIAAGAGAAAAPGAARIQLGAFGSKDLAETVWKKLSGRFDYLAAATHSVEPVETGGKTLYRLRASAASAKDGDAMCGKLRVAGESCMVVH
ncbi:SPOR domain-containing protein [Sphingobium nicotianae]|uniref:SPOR domain-containing protein n=1 Tax=Sphingobium nicotianae TaxID=2782607 RepID=A0A9X1DDR4_9SPHN|nr:SPOR domain-containing protein [Sphingobium nicotianae]MBT2187999.1 SPOR domain-containing protein [Sphingobium nicotianae]